MNRKVDGIKLIGKIKKIYDKETFCSGFIKRRIVLRTSEQYPQNILIDFIQDRIDLVNSLKINDKVKVFINIRGREWKNPEGIIKYFNSIQGWRVEKICDEYKNKVSKNNDFTEIEEFEDLPF